MGTSDITKVKKDIFEQIVNGNLIQADALKKNNGLSVVDIKDIVEKAFHELIKSKNNLLAIKVSDHYNFPVSYRLEAVTHEFRNLIKNKAFEKAIEWGLKYNLPINEINNVAVRAFNYALDNRDVQKAIEIKNRYDIPSTLVSSSGLQWFNILFEKKDYIKAMLIGQEFEISRKRTLTAGVRGYHQLIKTQEIERFIKLERKYNVLGDSDILQIEESDMKQFNAIFVQNVVRESLKNEKAGSLSQIIDSLGIFEKKDKNPLLSFMVKDVVDEVAVVHNTMMDAGRISDAYRLVDSFRLLTDIVSADVKSKIIASAETAHHKLIAEDNLQAAKSIKENYGLFEKNIISDSLETVAKVTTKYLKRALQSGDIQNAQVIIKEYGLAKSVIKDTADTAIIDMLHARKYVEVFETINMLRLSIDNQAVKAEAFTAFEEAFDNGQLELAANLGHYFRLSDKRILQAAYSLWKKHMDAGRYNRAMDYKKTHKIPRKLTEPVVREIYDSLINQGETEQAKFLRNEYRISMSLWDWILELLKKFFK